MILVSRPHSIEELAEEISLTKNPMRAQIVLLQREGLAQVQGALKSLRKPAALYRLTPGSHVYFWRAYPVVLSHLVLVLSNKAYYP